MSAILRLARQGLVAAIGMALSADIAAGQGVLRQTVVVTAAATPVELGTVTRTLTVITREQIAALPVNSIADILRLVASVDVRARGDRGVQTDFSVRGAGFGQMLVLVDGIRINDAQSGHHNGDIPVPLDAIERVEVLHGVGSSLFGADAFGGTVNVITRRDLPPASATLEGGSFDLVSGRARGGFENGALRQSFAGSAERSTGFMYERQFKTTNLMSQTAIGDRSNVSISYLWKDFGANGFYGNAPSHEWTNQTLVTADRRLGELSGWRVDAAASYRTHGDHFLFNVERPALSENRHRTHAVFGSMTASRSVGSAGSVTAGVNGGSDWVRSTNLGDHSIARVSGFGEWRQALSSRTQVDASVRVDRYDEFGASWSPSAGIGWWPGTSLRLRASAGRAFRVPTFTERYYSDPANLARADTGPEAAWAGEGGADVFLSAGWLVQATVFGRRDHDVIDWLRATPAERWRTYNVHHVTTRGVELTARKALGNGAFLQAEYTAIDLDPETVSTLCGASQCLSKYVLEFAPHALTGVAVIPLPAALRIAPQIEYKHRRRNAGTFDYAVVDLRVSRRFERFELRLDGTNLGDRHYQEIAGVDMPGRAATVSIVVGKSN